MARVHSPLITLFSFLLCVPTSYLAAQSTPQGVRFGLNSFLGNLSHSELRPPTVKTTETDRTNYLDAVRDLGVTTIRETFMNWAEIEPEPGKGYLFADFDDFARKASERRIEVVALLYPFPAWATGKQSAIPERDYVFLGHLPLRKFEGEFRQFVRTTVTRYCGCKTHSLKLEMPIRHWIFFNEPDSSRLDPDDYAHWLRIFYEEVKSADPAAKVVAPALATSGLAFGAPGLDTIPPTFLAKLLNSKELQGPSNPYLDILNFHIYPVHFGPDPNIYSINAAYGYIRKVLNVHKLYAEVWLTEIGDNSPDYALQADRDVKLLIHAASTGVNRVHLHGLWDFAPPELWGVLENTPSGKVPVKKPSFFAYQTLLRKIGDNRGVQFLGPGRYRALVPKGKFVYILWTEGPNTETPCFLRGHLLITELSGKEKSIGASDLKLTNHPMFVEQVE